MTGWQAEMRPDGILPPIDSVTRFEVIDPTGRLLVRYGVQVAFDFQDAGRTLKVFLMSRDDYGVVDVPR